MLIGIDGGGTGTRMVLAENDGKVIGTIKGPATNISDIGLDEGVNRLSDMLTLLLKDRSQQITSVYAGIAGSGNPKIKRQLNTALISLLPEAHIVKNDTDAFNPLFSHSTEGIVVIAGTGSSAFAVTDGVCHQVGGWGYLIDDAGSGYRIGSDVLKAAYMAYDGRGNETLLKTLCEEKLGYTLKEAIPLIYKGGKTYIASFAPLAFEAKNQGDNEADLIVKQAAAAIALSIKTCLKYINSYPACAVLSGGLTNNKAFIGMITDALGTDAPKVKLTLSDMPPVYGALVKAAFEASIEVSSSFKANFISTYKE